MRQGREPGKRSRWRLLPCRLGYASASRPRNRMQRVAGISGKCTASTLAVVLFLAFLLLATTPGCQSAAEETAPPIDYLPTEPSSSDNSTAILNTNVELITTEPDPDGGELLAVSLAAEGAYILVEFKAPPLIAQNWWEGSIYVIEEATDVVYSDIPTMPTVGPLIGHPVEEGQIGYVMLSNTVTGIRSGSVVSVILGRFKREHVTVQ